MDHYDDTQWVDYVRGLPSGEGAELTSHLDSGCSECEGAMRLFKRVATVAAHDIEHEPPAYAVRSVRAFFSMQQVEPETGLVRLLTLTPAFDSLAQSAAAGFRGMDTASRQLVYYGNDYALTLRMDYDKDVSLGGELLHRTSGPVPNVPALLMSGHTVLGYSLSGELGEFCMTCEQDEPIRLRMLVGEDELIEIDLDWSPETA